MRYLQLAIILALTTLLATPAFADRTHHRSGDDHFISYGERVEHHRDRKGDMIQHRFEHKALHAEVKGKYRKADRMRAKGERINRHLDRKGERMHTHYDRRHRGKHSHRHYSVSPRVVYRHNPYGTYFGLVFNQPGFSIGWGWYD